MQNPRYVFDSLWSLRVPPAVAFETLKDLSTYPAWWKEIKEVEQVSDEVARVVVRSFLPYTLRFELHRSIEDPTGGILETQLAGDLDGFSRWTISETSDGCDCAFREEVETTRRWLNTVTPFARPAFRANHALMMRSGLRGLRSYLARPAPSPAGEEPAEG